MDQLDLRDQYLAKIQAEGTYRLVVAEHLTELLEAVSVLAQTMLARKLERHEQHLLLRLIAAHDRFVPSAPPPATPDQEV